MHAGDSQATRLSLISRVKTDDSEAWRDLVELYGPLVRFWCRRSGLNDVSSSDCVQNVFMAVLRSLDQYRGGNHSFRAWLWTITRNKIIDAARAEQRQTHGVGGSTALSQLNQLPESFEAGGSLSRDLDESNPTEQWQLRELLRRAMQQLKNEFEPKTWRIFERSVIDGLSSASVSEELSVTPAAVRKYRSRILRRLRQQLGDVDND